MVDYVPPPHQFTATRVYMAIIQGTRETGFNPQQPLALSRRLRPVVRQAVALYVALFTH